MNRKKNEILSHVYFAGSKVDPHLLQNCALGSVIISPQKGHLYSGTWSSLETGGKVESLEETNEELEDVDIYFKRFVFGS